MSASALEEYAIHLGTKQEMAEGVIAALRESGIGAGFLTPFGMTRLTELRR